MKKVRLYIVYEPMEEIENISNEQLSNYINRLDGKKNIGLILEIETKLLILLKSSSERFNVKFIEYDKDGSMLNYAILLDTNKNEDEEIDFLLENGQVDAITMNRTVESELTHKIALYFWQYSTFPAGLTWDVPV